jgi:hypothetical protein
MSTKITKENRNLILTFYFIERGGKVIGKGSLTMNHLDNFDNGSSSKYKKKIKNKKPYRYMLLLID